MAAATAERPQNVAGPKIGRPAMKQPNNIITSYNTPHEKQLAIIKTG